MKYMSCCTSFCPSLPPKRGKMDCTHDFTFPQFKLRNGVAAADSRSIAVRGADVDQAALILSINVPPACPMHSLHWKEGKSTQAEAMNQVLGWQLCPGVRPALCWALLKQTTSERSLNQEYRSLSATAKGRNRSHTSSKGQPSLWHPWKCLMHKTPWRGSRGLKSPSLWTEASKDKDLSSEQGRIQRKERWTAFFFKFRSEVGESNCMFFAQPQRGGKDWAQGRWISGKWDSKPKVIYS